MEEPCSTGSPPTVRRGDRPLRRLLIPPLPFRRRARYRSAPAEQLLEGRRPAEGPLVRVGRCGRRTAGDQVAQLGGGPLDPIGEGAGGGVAAGPVLGGGEHRRRGYDGAQIGEQRP